MATALPAEYGAVVGHLADRSEVTHQKGSVYEVGRFAARSSEWTVAVLQTGAGNPPAALEVERAISHFEPEVVFFVGIAGGLKDVRVGDVVAATKVYNYETGRAEEEFRPRPTVGESSYRLIQLANSVARNSDWIERIGTSPNDSKFPTPRALVGPIAAGEKVVVSERSQERARLRQTYSDALAVEMEGSGFLRAIHANDALPALVIRGISDLLEGKTASDAVGSQEVAAKRAAAFAFEILARFEPTFLATSQTPENCNAGEVLTACGVQSVHDELTEIATGLYPRGPTDRAIWSRAGGDVASLHLCSIGKTDWFNAITDLRHGGGGTGINAGRLVQQMLSDFPNNVGLERLSDRLGA